MGLGKGDGEMPWEFWGVVVTVIGVVVVLVAFALIRGWVEVHRAQPAAPAAVPTPVATPIPAPVAPTAPAVPAEGQEEDPEKILARATAEDARSAVGRLARAATRVSLERRLLDAVDTEREAHRIRARREAIQEEIYPPLPQRTERRERVRVAAADEAPAAPQPRQPQPAAQNAGQARRQGRWADAATNAAATEQDVRDKGYGDAFYGRPEVLPAGLNAQQQGWYRAAYQEGLTARRGQPAAPAAPQPAAAPAGPQPNVAALAQP